MSSEKNYWYFTKQPIAGSVMRQGKEPHTQGNIHRWLLPYADMMLLLMVCFLMLWGAAQQRFKEATLEPTLLAHETSSSEGIPMTIIQKAVPRQATQSMHALSGVNIPSSWTHYTDTTNQSMSYQSLHESRHALKHLLLPEHTCFALGESTLVPQAKKDLEALLPWLKKTLKHDPHLRIQIIGTSDPSPNQEAGGNWMLANARASLVAHYLHQRTGLPTHLFSVLGMTSPIDISLIPLLHQENPDPIKPTSENSSSWMKFEAALRQNPRRIAMIVWRQQSYPVLWVEPNL